MKKINSKVLLKKTNAIVKEYLTNNNFTIHDITQERLTSIDRAYLVKYKNKKFKVVYLNKVSFENITKYSPLMKNVPRIFYSKDNVVITEWINGRFIKENKATDNEIKAIAKLQASINLIKPKLANRKRLISSLNNFVKRTLSLKQLKKVFTINEINTMKNIYNNNFPKNPRVSLIHGDLGLDNLIKTKDKWFSIDNTTLQINLTGFDLVRALCYICKDDKQKKIYLKEYNKIINIDFYKKHEDFYYLIFLLRKIKSKIFKTGKTSKEENKRLVYLIERFSP